MKKSTNEKSSQEDLPVGNEELSIYLDHILTNPLLSKEDEISLAIKIEKGRWAGIELLKERGISSAHFELLQLIDDGLESKNKLIISNTRLVISVAKKYTGRGIPFSDLIQEGNIGLIRAVGKYDYRREIRFSTYATYWITQSIARYIVDHGRTIRIAFNTDQLEKRMIYLRQLFYTTHARLPRIDELAKLMNITPEKVQFLSNLPKEPLSLDKPIYEDSNETLEDILCNDEADLVSDIVNKRLIEKFLNEMLGSLSAREEEIIKLRYGFFNGEIYTLSQIAKIFGISKERVRQIEEQALNKFRKPEIYKYLAEQI